jgi:hypothetical protein
MMDFWSKDLHLKMEKIISACQKCVLLSQYAFETCNFPSLQYLLQYKINLVFNHTFPILYLSGSSLQWNNKKNLANKYYPEVVIILQLSKCSNLPWNYDFVHTKQCIHTCGYAAITDLAANGVQNKFDRMMFSSATLCSFNTATALITVFPVPKDETVKCANGCVLHIRELNWWPLCVSIYKASPSLEFVCCYYIIQRVCFTRWLCFCSQVQNNVVDPLDKVTGHSGMQCFNHLKTKHRLLYLKTQFVPHSKHFYSQL